MEAKSQEAVIREIVLSNLPSIEVADVIKTKIDIVHDDTDTDHGLGLAHQTKTRRNMVMDKTWIPVDVRAAPTDTRNAETNPGSEIETETAIAIERRTGSVESTDAIGLLRETTLTKTDTIDPRIAAAAGRKKKRGTANAIELIVTGTDHPSRVPRGQHRHVKASLRTPISRFKAVQGTARHIPSHR